MRSATMGFLVLVPALGLAEESPRVRYDALVKEFGRALKSSMEAYTKAMTKDPVRHWNHDKAPTTPVSPGRNKSMNMHDLPSLLAVALGLIPAAPADPPETVTDAVRSTVEGMRKETAKYQAALNAAKTREEQARLVDDHQQRTLRVTALLMRNARDFPWHPAALDACSWILLEADNPGTEADEAFALLRKTYISPSPWAMVDHLSDPRMANLCLGLTNRQSFGDVTSFYRAVISRTKDRRVRAVAMYSLAICSLRASQSIRKVLASGAGPGARLGQVLYTEGERRRLAAEADALFQQLVDEYAGIEHGDSTLGDIAGAFLAGEAVKLGEPAQEIDGADARGARFKLSDHRGKVVVLNFWAGWCGPCMDLLPAERAMSERQAGRPFALLGVNSDVTMEAFRKVASSKGDAPRSWWNGAEGMLSARWGVEAYPTFFVIDRKGVIRAKFEGSQAMRDGSVEKLVEELLKED